MNKPHWEPKKILLLASELVPYREKEVFLLEKMRMELEWSIGVVSFERERESKEIKMSGGKRVKEIGRKWQSEKRERVKGTERKWVFIWFWNGEDLLFSSFFSFFSLVMVTCILIFHFCLSNS